MTNEEKYKTTNDRVYAFRKHCRDKGTCHGCTLNETGVSRTICVDRCILDWLALEAEEEKPLPCPFCGEDDIDIFETDFGQSEEPYQFAVRCKSCGALVSAEDRGAAIAAWNRRAGGNTGAKIPR